MPPTIHPAVRAERGSARRPTERRLAGLAADLYGTADARPPLVLLPGLSFDRAIWRPLLDRLERLELDRQVLVLDLPGHGGSPNQPSHSLPAVVEVVHRAVTEAGLVEPVMVGHSISGGLVSVYAAHHPTRGVINIDAPPELASFARMLQPMAEQIRGTGFDPVWAMMERSFRTDLLPPDARALVAATSHPRQDLVVSYWEDLLTQTPEQLTDWLTDEIVGVATRDVPYLLIAGNELPPGLSEWITRTVPRATVEVWAGSGHFPHLAHPDRFAVRLAGTARW